MHTSPGFRLLVALALATTAAVRHSEGAEQADGAGGLRWTPHRRSLAERDDASGSAPAADPVAATATPPAAKRPTTAQPAAAPGASVGLPAGVPAVEARPLRSPTAMRRDDLRRAQPPGGFGESFRRAIDPGNPQGIFGAAFNRAPQGDVGRPLLGDERPRRSTAVAPAQAARPTPAPARTGAVPQRGQRPARIALNAEGMPSVLAPQPTPAVAPTPTASPAPGPSPQQLPAPRSTARMAPSEGMPTPAYPEGLPSDSGEIIIEDPSNSMTLPEGGTWSPEMGGEAWDPGLDGSAGPMFPDGIPDGMVFEDGGVFDDGQGMIGPGWTGETYLHVPSPYDDPFACEDGEPCGCLPFYEHDGRICAFLRRFGRPYYGWRWYRDFSASAGVTSYQNPLDLGLLGNYGFNEYVNWGMPFWNAFGVGWQVGVRGVQSDFQSTTVRVGTTPLSNGSRNQVFLTTGFYTRAFEGRGFQGGAVWDYLHDDLYDDVDLSQVRGEVSYVWGFNEFGFWGTANTMGRNNVGPAGLVDTDTIDIYAGFYRLLFGDANEWKAWAGGTGDADFILGSLVRAPMNRSLALEGTFTYLIPQASKTIPLAGTTLQGYSGQAWNVSVNVVWYPACRARRGLSSPYRPLFEVADNGSMIRTLAPVR